MNMQKDQRKVQKTGMATFTISLPKTWIVKNKINTGEFLSIFEEKDGSLHISRQIEQKISEEKTIIVDNKKEDHIIRELVGNYLNGAHVIKIISKKDLDLSLRKNVVKQAKKLIGFEIIEEDNKSIIIQDFFSADNLSIIKSLRRSHNISSLMLKEAMKILNKESKSMDNIQLWEDEVDRLYLLVKKQLGFAMKSSLKLKQLNLTTTDCMNYLLLIKIIENITDNTYYVAKDSMELAGKIDEKLLEKINEVASMLLIKYDKSVKSIMTKDLDLANQILDKKKRIFLKIKSINVGQYNLNKNDQIRVDSLLLNLFNMRLNINDISEMAIDHILQ
jgi:phosphate uptake regulator